MAAPLLIDLSHTSHTRARTGIQRVVRSLFAALGERAVGLTFDPYQATWRTLQSWERTNLDAIAPAAKRGAHWPLAARWRGRIRRFTGQADRLPPDNGGLVVPELFSPIVGAALPRLFANIQGPRVAVFHDAIALKRPELTPAKTVARFPAYLAELRLFDGIAAVSDDSRDTLIDYWRWAGVKNAPPVRTIPLGIEIPKAAPPRNGAPARPDGPGLLSIGSVEGRKNHLALLEAAEQLWANGERFTLRLIGLAQAETGQLALDRIRSLQAAGRPLHYDGPADEATLTAAYAACAFTLYPSVLEGFGLPVLESLAHGKPCICSARGALGESARGGGCVMLDQMDAPSLATAIKRLLAHPEERIRLEAEAAGRRFRTWEEYTKDLTAWMETLRRS